MIRFSDQYLAVCAPSSVDPTIKGAKYPGAVLLYRRSDCKLAGQVKLAGNHIGTSMEIVGNTLYLGFPGMTHVYRSPGSRLKDLWEYVGGVYAFKMLPGFKKPLLLTSPTGLKPRSGFGLHMKVDENGDLLVSEGDKVHRIDPEGQQAPGLVEAPQDFFPELFFTESDGVRMTTKPRLFDVASRSPLVEFDAYSGGAVGGGAVFLDDFASSVGLMRVPLQHCGNFDHWVRLGGQESAGVGDPSADGNANGVPDIEDYILAQTGALPGVEVAEDPFTYGHPRARRVKLKANGVLPPDATMLVEYRYLDQPWKLCAVKRGKGKLRLSSGKEEAADGWTPTLQPIFAMDYVEFRTSFMHSQAAALGQEELRVLVD